jgi:four helix bundle protein
MGTTDFKSLRAYQLSRVIAAEMYSRVELWPAFHQRTIGVQLVRAADSVSANIAEAVGRWHVADQRRLLFIARGSLRELEHWIPVAQERGLLPEDAAQDLAEVGRTLSGLIRRRAHDL